MTRTNNRNARLTERVQVATISRQTALEMRRAAIHAVRECDRVLGWQTVIKRIAVNEATAKEIRHHADDR